MPSLSDRAARGMIALMVAQIWIMLSGYIIAVALARSLGPALFGVYGVVYSVLLSVELIGRLGLPQAVSKLVAEKGSSAQQRRSYRRDFSSHGLLCHILDFFISCTVARCDFQRA